MEKMNVIEEFLNGRIKILRFVWFTIFVCMVLYYFLAHWMLNQESYSLLLVLPSNIFVIIISLFLIILFYLFPNIWSSQKKLEMIINEQSDVDTLLKGIDKSAINDVKLVFEYMTKDEREQYCIISNLFLGYFIRFGIIQLIPLVGLMYSVQTESADTVNLFILIAIIGGIIMKPFTLENVREIHTTLKKI